ncbi:MAG: hypothetical protein JWO78_2000 [Micavibrio sp.]|nr:hypothetical protein [Micavibrio sp.]
MKTFKPALALLAALPFTLAASSKPRTEPVPQEIAVTSINYRLPKTPAVNILAKGICGKHLVLTSEPSAEGNTLVMTFTLHASPCKPGETPKPKSYRMPVDLAKEAAAAGISTPDSKIKAFAVLAND